MWMFWVQLNRGVFQIWGSFFLRLQSKSTDRKALLSCQCKFICQLHLTRHFDFTAGKTAWTLVASNRIISVEIEQSTKSLLIDNVNWIERSLLLFEMIRVILKSNELRGYHAGNRIPRCLLWFCLWMNV